MVEASQAEREAAAVAAPEPSPQLPLLQEEQAPKRSKTADNAARKETAPPQGEPNVVSIDSFRKKS